jgi:hypothetical protein
MKKLFLIAFMALSLNAVAQLTYEQKKDPMRPKGMIEVGALGKYDKHESDADIFTFSVRYYLKGIFVGVRYYIQGANNYKYYWIPKHCKCSQEHIKAD